MVAVSSLVYYSTLLQNAIDIIAKYESYFISKRQKCITKCVKFFITKSHSFITKCGSYCKLRRLFNNASVQW